jgi:hypothetical protein
MRTIGDLERWLKGAGAGYVIEMQILTGKKRGKFAVDLKGAHLVEAEGSTLEGALENAMEELRRKENGAESMRTEPAAKKINSGLTASQMQAAISALSRIMPKYTWPGSTSSSGSSQLFCPQHGTYLPTSGTCPQCSATPKVSP